MLLIPKEKETEKEYIYRFSILPEAIKTIKDSHIRRKRAKNNFRNYRKQVAGKILGSVINDICEKLSPEDDFIKKLRKVAADPTIVKGEKYTSEAFYPQLDKLTKNKDNFIIVDEIKQQYLLPVRKADNAPVNLNALLEAAALLVEPISNDEIDEVSMHVHIDGKGKLRSLFFDVFTNVPNELF